MPQCILVLTLCVAILSCLSVSSASLVTESEQTVNLKDPSVASKFPSHRKMKAGMGRAVSHSTRSPPAARDNVCPSHSPTLVYAEPLGSGYSAGLQKLQVGQQLTQRPDPVQMEPF